MKTKVIFKSAIIAALYAAMTLCLMPISYGIIQMRVSEVLTILPKFSKSSIYGLTCGCFIANYLGMVISGTTGIIDIVFGTLATFIAAVLSYHFKNNKFLVAFFPVFTNGIIVGTYLHYIAFPEINLLLCMISVAIGEGAVTYMLGIPLINFIIKNKRIGEYISD